MTQKKRFLTHPFHFVGGIKAFVAGIIVLSACGILAYYTQFRYDGFIDFHVTSQSRYIYLLDPFVNWLVFALLICTAGWLFKKHYRVIDVLGMSALAFVPNLFMPVIAHLFNLHKIMSGIGNVPVLELSKGLQPYLVQLILSSILMLIFAILFIYLTYQAYHVNLNLKKSQNIIVFIALFIITEVLTVLLLRSY